MGGGAVRGVGLVEVMGGQSVVSCGGGQCVDSWCSVESVCSVVVMGVSVWSVCLESVCAKLM